MPADQVKPYDPVRGGNARYDTSQMWVGEDGRLTDGVYHYDSNGLAWDRPDDLSNTADTSGGGGGGGGSAAFADPYFQQYQSLLNAEGAADAAGTREQLQQLLIALGMVPEGFQDKMGALDDTVRELIRKNTESGISQYARMLEAKKDTQRASIGGLSSRGLLRSGAKGFRLRRDQLNFDRGLHDTLSSVLANAGGLQSGYASRERQRQMGLSQFLSQLMSNYRFPTTTGGPVPGAPQLGQPPSYSPSANPWLDYTGNTIGSGPGGYGTPYGPAAPGQGGGFTSPKKPLLYA